ncbi:MAG: DNA polymerase III subunit gamma/tau, partial [Firmicutes bacterium]|nr:DNA polymerase III subunit gamma/tau [Bacillota bacterium]
MAYTALYRKYRPDTFEKVIGQDHIVRTLKNQMTSGRVSHAYLFCGTRGTGKTSTAKIFARAINCLDLHDGEPCNECELCTAMNEGRSVNVIEIDAASNNGVDNIREIREEVKYAPSEGKYKVYIIDEVHMLSTGAFNALLKTLEEPPEHVIFILATTDPQKVPATIHSRCQRFDFKRINSGQIVASLKTYIENENVNIDDDALHYVAQLGDGSMRDSLSILDQCLSFYYGERITADKVREIAGAVDDNVLYNMLDAVLEKDCAKAISIVDEIMSAGRDLNHFVDEMIQHLRNLLVVSTAEDAESLLDMSMENVDRLNAQIKRISAEEIIYFIREFSLISADIKYASNKRVMLEVGLIKLCSPASKTDVTALAAKVAYLEREVKNGVKTVQVVSAEAPKEKKAPKKPKPKAMSEDLENVKAQWDDFLDEFDVVERSFLERAKIGDMEDGRLTLICESAGEKGILDRKLDNVKAKLEQSFGKEFDVKTITSEEYTAWEKMTYG